MVTRSYVDYSRAGPGIKSGLRAGVGCEPRAAHGQGAAGGPKGTRTAYFYGGGFFPFGQTWGGGGFAPPRLCPIGPPPPPPPQTCVDDPANPCPTTEPTATPQPTDTPKPTKSPKH